MANDYLEVNPLGIIDQDKANESHEATVPTKGTLNSSFDTADHDFHVMEGFGARDVRHEEGISDDRPFKFVSNSSISTDDSATIDAARVSISQAGNEQSASGTTLAKTALSAEGTEGFQAAAKSANATSTLSTAVAADAVATSAVSAEAAGFPDATNTGLKAGVALTKYNGTLHITQDNAVISNMDITGDVIIDAKNVTMSNVKVSSNGAWTAIKVMDGATGFTLQDSEIDGGAGGNGIYGHGTFLRNDIHDIENGINVSGPSEIGDNYIHDFRGSSEAHYDGIEVNAGHDIHIFHNTVIVDQSQTSAVMLDNYFGGLSNITVENNRLAGGGYTVYLDGRFGGGPVDDSTIKIINNQIGDGAYGDFAFYDNKPIVYGNTDLDTLPDTPDTPDIPDTVVYTGTTGDDSLPVAGNTSSGNETYKGLAGNDLLKGGAGADVLDGGADTDVASYAGSSAAVKVSLLAGTASGGDATGDKLTDIESLLGSSYADTLTGNAGGNVLNGGTGADKLDGGSGTDTASYIGATAGVTASLANSSINTGDAKGDVYVSIEQLTGSSYADKLTGDGGANLLAGGSGDDVLNGGSGNDTLYGGLGADDLTGARGADTFAFKALTDTTVSTSGRDTIFDFSGTGGDRIDLSAIDANASASGDQAFTYLGAAAFTGKAGELRTVKQASDTYIYGDTNGDKTADFAIHLDDAISLSKGYFVL
ncbi:calcium-binding protein [Rhizobium herbae]|uniref:RTX toxin n=1 Tax=Rhizobium herbae TaxID=508661 RepID=A0ABS4EHI6_9HYPH|nr:hypothetical protein [Rhizobium herbae]MBP1857402.1 hypothetical protein [Rhizobium herbae]